MNHEQRTMKKKVEYGSSFPCLRNLPTPAEVGASRRQAKRFSAQVPTMKIGIRREYNVFRYLLTLTLTLTLLFST